MHLQYEPIVRRLVSDKPTAKVLCQRLKLRRLQPQHVMSLQHADIVLELLHLNRLHWVEAFIGKPITRCPTRRFELPKVRRRAIAEQQRREGDDRRVLLVGPNPRQPGSKIHHRYSLIRPGLTISQLLVRGCRRREINGAMRRRWIVVEGEA